MSTTEFGSTEDVLAHFGVKGMKWGVTRPDASGGAGGVARVVKKPKPTAAQIHNARAKIASQQRQINNQIDKTNLATGRQQSREAKKLSDMSTNYLKNPDRATALRLTEGEKFVLALASVALPVAGTAYAATIGASHLAERKSVEAEQRRLKSNK